MIVIMLFLFKKFIVPLSRIEVMVLSQVYFSLKYLNIIRLSLTTAYHYKNLLNIFRPFSIETAHCQQVCNNNRFL